MSGLLNTSKIAFGFTSSPDRASIFATWLSNSAGIQIMSSGTRVPRPRTSRTMGPRFTESIQTVARSTVGAAGFSFESRQLIAPTAATVSVRMMIRRIIFFFATPSRFTSIAIKRSPPIGF